MQRFSGEPALSNGMLGLPGHITSAAWGEVLCVTVFAIVSESLDSCYIL